MSLFPNRSAGICDSEGHVELAFSVRPRWKNLEILIEILTQNNKLLNICPVVEEEMAAGVSHDSPRTPNAHISGLGASNTTKIPREDTQREKKSENGGGRGEKSDIMGGPAEGLAEGGPAEGEGLAEGGPAADTHNTRTQHTHAQNTSKAAAKKQEQQQCSSTAPKAPKTAAKKQTQQQSSSRAARAAAEQPKQQQ